MQKSSQKCRECHLLVGRDTYTAKVSYPPDAVVDDDDDIQLGTDDIQPAADDLMVTFSGAQAPVLSAHGSRATDQMLTRGLTQRQGTHQAVDTLQPGIIKTTGSQNTAPHNVALDETGSQPKFIFKCSNGEALKV